MCITEPCTGLSRKELLGSGHQHSLVSVPLSYVHINSPGHTQEPYHSLPLTAALYSPTKLFDLEDSTPESYQPQVLCGERLPQISLGDPLQKILCWNNFYCGTELTY